MSRGAPRGDGLCLGYARLEILRDSWKRRHEPQFSVMSTEKYSQWVDESVRARGGTPVGPLSNDWVYQHRHSSYMQGQRKGFLWGVNMDAEDAGLGWRAGIADLVHRLVRADERSTD